MEADRLGGAWRRRGGTVIFLLLGVWLTCTPPISAHAVLERSDPPANAALRQPPRQVVLRFTEPVDAALSSVTVIDREGRRVSGTSTVSADRRSIAVSLSDLEEGIYAVKWRVLSALDGHATSGVFLFAVGLSFQPAPGGAGTSAPSPYTVAARWIALSAAVVLTGSMVFRVAALRPALVEVEAGGFPLAEPRVTAAFRRLTLITVPVLLLSIFVHLLLQGAELLDTSVWGTLTSPTLWTLLVGTKLGWSVLIQASLGLLLLVRQSERGRVIQAVGLVLIGGIVLLAAIFGGPAALASSIHTVHLLLVVLAAVLYGLLSMARRPGHADWIPVLASAGLLGGFTVTSHAVGSGVLAIAADWTHLIATGVWIGGLLSLLVVLGSIASPHRTQLARTVVPRFSTVAGIALGVLIVTGVYSAWMQVPALRAFTVTPYGRTLLIKLILVVPLLALGAVNRFVTTPLLKATGANVPPLLRLLGRVVGGEVLLGAAILLVVAVLTITPPARVTLPGPATAKTVDLAGFAGDVRVSLSVSPAQPGWNRFEVRAERDGTPIGSEVRVLLRLTKLDEQLDPVLLRPNQQEAGRYTIEAGEMALPGWWELEVVMRRAGRLDASTSFALRLGEPATASADPGTERLAEHARRAAASLRSWREVLQMADGNGGVSVTWFELQAPDRMHYRTREGAEVIVIGSTRFFQTAPGTWERDTAAEPFKAQGALAYLKEMRSVARGRQTPCANETCQVVLWEWDRTTAFAALVGIESYRTHMVMMAAPSHYMTVQYGDFNGPIRIVAPR